MPFDQQTLMNQPESEDFSDESKNSSVLNASYIFLVTSDPPIDPQLDNVGFPEYIISSDQETTATPLKKPNQKPTSKNGRIKKKKKKPNLEEIALTKEQKAVYDLLKCFFLDGFIEKQQFLDLNNKCKSIFRFIMESKGISEQFENFLNSNREKWVMRTEKRTEEEKKFVFRGFHKHLLEKLFLDKPKKKKKQANEKKCIDIYTNTLGLDVVCEQHGLKIQDVMIHLIAQVSKKTEKVFSTFSDKYITLVKQSGTFVAIFTKELPEMKEKCKKSVVEKLDKYFYIQIVPIMNSLQVGEITKEKVGDKKIPWAMFEIESAFENLTSEFAEGD